MKENKGNSAVFRVRKYFPQVNQVVDAKDTIEVSVTKKDSKSAKPKNPSQCALAQACCRELKADGAIINLGYSYVIKGEVATRYTTSVAVGREITSFDRGGEFEAGWADDCTAVNVEIVRRGEAAHREAEKPDREFVERVAKGLKP